MKFIIFFLITFGMKIWTEKLFHQCASHVLNDLGIQDTVLMWLTSYLTKRAPVVKVNGAKSDTMKLDCGVPQGLVLGLFCSTSTQHHSGSL
jgi:hypothetical protein